MNKFMKSCLLCWCVCCFMWSFGWAQTPEGTPDTDIAQWQEILKDITTEEQAWKDAAEQLAGLTSDDANQALITAIETLQQMLTDTTTEAQIWQEAFIRLDWLDSEEAKQAVREAMTQLQSLLQDLSSDEEAWREAAKRLAGIESDEAKPALLRATNHMQNILQESTTTKEEWMEGVKRLVILDTEESRDALLNFFTEDPERAKVTYDTLRSFDGQVGWGNYMALARTEGLRSDLRKMAINGLGERKVDKARELLFQLTQNELEDIRCAAMSSLGDLGDERALSLLMNIVRNKECSEGNRASVARYISKLSGTQAEAYLSELTASDEERVSEAARWALAEYQNRALQGQAAVGTAFEVEEQGNGIVLISEEQPSASVGYLIGIARNDEWLDIAFTPSGSVTELHLPTGDYTCVMRCFVPERLYSPYWEGGAAGFCDESQHVTLSVQQSDIERISFQGIAPSIDLASLVQSPEQFVDQPFFLVGTLGNIPGVEAVWGSSTRKDWKLSQNGQTVLVTNSSMYKFDRRDRGKQVAVVGELKRSALRGGYRLVSITDWLIEEQEDQPQ